MKIKPEVVGGFLLLISSLAHAHKVGTCTTASGPNGSGGTFGDSCGERSNQGNPSVGTGGTGGSGGGVSVNLEPQYAPIPDSRGEVQALRGIAERVSFAQNAIADRRRNILVVSENFNKLLNKVEATPTDSMVFNDLDLAWKHLNQGARNYKSAKAVYGEVYGKPITIPVHLGGLYMQGTRQALASIKELETYLDKMKERVDAANKKACAERNAYPKKCLSNDPPEHIKRFERQAKAECARNSAQRIRVTNSLPPVQRASQVEALIQQTNTYSRQMLSQVSGQMEQQASDFLEEELKLSEELAFQGVDVARCGSPTEIVRIWTDLALDISNAVNNFSLGVMSGNYGAFVTASEALIAVAHDPSLIGHLSKNMIHLLSEGPGATAEATKQAFGRVAGVYTSFKKTMLTGNAFERGEALGRIGADILIAATGHTFVMGSVHRFGELLSQVPHPKLGKAMIKAIETSPKLAPAVADATANMLKEAKAAVMRNFPRCKAVREGYISEVTGLKDVAETFLEQGHDEEFVARHVHQLRRDIGQKYKDLTPAEVRPYIYERNIGNGVDPLGPSIKDLRQGYAGAPPKSWREIIDSASRPSKKINAFFEITMGNI